MTFVSSQGDEARRRPGREGMRKLTARPSRISICLFLPAIALLVNALFKGGALHLVVARVGRATNAIVAASVHQEAELAHALQRRHVLHAEREGEIHGERWRRGGTMNAEMGWGRSVLAYFFRPIKRFLSSILSII